MISLSHVSVSRGRRTVLHDITFTAQAGQVTVIIGPNGSGKSTALGAMAGTLPYQGSIRINGAQVSETPPDAQAQDRAVMAQHTELAFAFDVAQVVAMGALAPVPPARITALLAQVGLAGFGPRDATTLSGGEAQRMHLARALLQAETGAGRPAWLMLDEPVSSLDLGHQLAVMRLARAHANGGGGVLAVLHDLNLAAMFSDQLVVIDKGRIAACGPPDQVLTEGLIAQVYDCRIPLRLAPQQGVWFALQAAGAA